MNTMFRSATWMALVASVSLAACVSPTRIESNTASGIAIEPKKLFVFSHIGNEFGDGFYQPFTDRFSAQLRTCGVDSAMTTVGDLDLDNNIHTEKMKSFAPDYTLAIRRNGGTRMDGRIVHVIYNVQMAQVPSTRNVWRANVNFYRGGTVIPIADRGEALADDLVNQMVADGLLKNCTLSPKKDAASKPRPVLSGQ